jgi:hypothetical protein
MVETATALCGSECPLRRFDRPTPPFRFPPVPIDWAQWAEDRAKRDFGASTREPSVRS